MKGFYVAQKYGSDIKSTVLSGPYGSYDEAHKKMLDLQKQQQERLAPDSKRILSMIAASSMTGQATRSSANDLLSGNIDYRITQK